ncbi:MAG: cyclase family protein [Saprospiraceae bacterium]
MRINFDHAGRNYSADLSDPIDLSIPLRNGAENPNCFWAPFPEFSPVRSGNFVGSTTEGGVVNFFNIRLNPHGNGTHTECVGHIAKERFVLRECLVESHFLAKVVSLYSRRTDSGDRVIFQDQIREVFSKNESKALIIRTLPNDDLKLRQNYSGTNPAYLHHEAVEYLVECGLKHLLLDLPSVDREEDGGQLLAHRAFWKYPHATRAHATITEMVFVPNTVKDGLYLLNLQTTSLDLDASPSKPVIYKLF